MPSVTRTWVVRNDGCRRVFHGNDPPGTVVEMSRASFASASMVVDDHCISHHSDLFRRDEGRGADLLWVTHGSGYIDITTATAHELEHSSCWEYEFMPADGTLKKDDGFYRAFIHNGANLYETVVEIPAYYID